MRLSRSAWVAGLALVLGAGLARAEEPQQQPPLVDNPQYQAWANYGVGSSETLEGHIDGGNGQKMTMESTHTLKEKTGEQVTIEITVTMEMMGQKHTSPPQQQVIKAKSEKQDVDEVGKEEVSAAGKAFNCKVYEAHSLNPQAGDAKARIWVSDQVPGGVVKMEASTPRGSITSLLKSFEIK